MFEPYIIDHGFADLDFFVATPLAREWYDPPKDYVLLEYEWVAKNIEIERKWIIDGGCHHGHYGIVFMRQLCNAVQNVDPHAPNLDVAEVNFKLNDADSMFHHAALWNESGTIRYSGTSNGAIVMNGEDGIEVPAFTLADVDPKAQVVKLDIEGAEYAVIPWALEHMPQIESWIIEFHVSEDMPDAPDVFAQMLASASYTLDWVNREKMVIEPYEFGTEWKTHSTLFARK